MKKALLTFCLALSTVITVSAADDKESKLFEEAYARDEEPATVVYIHPQIADMQMLSKDREVYGPYRFKLIKPGSVMEGELENAKARALYRATMESDADLMIGSLYDSYIVENDERYIMVEVSGYPAKYTNFRPLPLDTNTNNMIRVSYTSKSAETGTTNK
jgi:hypothetical protein